MRFLGKVAAAVCLLLMVGCKVEIIVPAEGGRVLAGSGSLSCGPAETCVVDVFNPQFSEVFHASADAGFVFLRWRGGAGFLCGDHRGPCAVSTDGFSDNAGLLAILDSEVVVSLQPVFAPLEVSEAWLQESYRLCEWEVVEGVEPVIADSAESGAFGVLAESFNIQPDSCGARSSYFFERSPLHGQPRLKKIVAKRRQSYHRIEDVTYYRYFNLDLQGEVVERLERTDQTLERQHPRNVRYEDTRIFHYETGSNGAGRYTGFEDYEVARWTFEPNDRAKTYSISWEHQAGESVTNANYWALNYRDCLPMEGYDCPIYESIVGNILYLPEPEGLATYNFYRGQPPGNKTIYPERDIYTPPIPPLPLTGQLETEHAWELPEALENYTLRSSEQRWHHTNRTVVSRRSAEGLPLEVLYIYWDIHTHSWRTTGKEYYGYRRDKQGTAYRWCSLRMHVRNSGQMDPAYANFNLFANQPRFFEGVAPPLPPNQ